MRPFNLKRLSDSVDSIQMRLHVCGGGLVVGFEGKPVWKFKGNHPFVGPLILRNAHVLKQFPEKITNPSRLSLSTLICGLLQTAPKQIRGAREPLAHGNKLLF